MTGSTGGRIRVMTAVQAWGTLVLGLVAMVVSIAAFVQAQRVAKRESYVVAREILFDLTSGEVGRARDVLGTLRYGDEGGWQALSYSDVINRYYILEWALERAGFGLKGLRPAGHQVEDAMRQTIRWHIDELSSTLWLLRAAFRTFDRDMVDDEAQQHLNATIKLVAATPATPSDQDTEVMADKLKYLRGMPHGGLDTKNDAKKSGGS